MVEIDNAVMKQCESVAESIKRGDKSSTTAIYLAAMCVSVESACIKIIAKVIKEQQCQSPESQPTNPASISASQPSTSSPGVHEDTSTQQGKS